MFDISRSMLASASRRDRAGQGEALSLRLAFPEFRRHRVAHGQDAPAPASSADEDAFAGRSSRRSPPSSRPHRVLPDDRTTLAALGAFRRNFFAPTARHRVIVVFTDGESRRVDNASIAATLRRPPGIKPVFVHVWSPDERVYTNGFPESDYRPDPASGSELRRLAAAAGGASFDEGRLGAVARSALLPRDRADRRAEPHDEPALPRSVPRHPGRSSARAAPRAAVALVAPTDASHSSGYPARPCRRWHD